MQGRTWDLACSEKLSATWSRAWARVGFRRGAVNLEEVKPMSARRKSRRTFAIELELDEAGWWVATAKGVEGVHTQGRSIQQVLRRIRNALEAAGEPGKTAQLVPEFHLSEELIAQVRKAKEARERADHIQAEAQALLREAAMALTKKLGVSIRDAGALLELSHQRIQQLVHSSQNAW
ncbi:MAG TPA: hypothetical protein VKB92_06205 [Myxococcales bacterium]|nr:hypothetical protein [Myxococcales bacterium]